MSPAIRYTCCGTRAGSCVTAPDFIVTTQYVNTDNTGEADYALTCSEHLAANVRFVAEWNAGFPTVEVRAWLADDDDERDETIAALTVRLAHANREIREVWAAVDVALSEGHGAATPALAVRLLAAENARLTGQLDVARAEVERLRREWAAADAARDALDRLDKVRALHRERFPSNPTCAVCRTDYPCATVRALDGAR